MFLSLNKQKGMRSNNIIPTFSITETFWGWIISLWGPLTNTSKYNNITTFYTF